MRIDSHHHFWNYSDKEYPWIRQEMSVLKRDYTPNDLKSEISRAGIDRVVSVQARQSEVETKWLLEIAERNNFVAGVVGWLPLAKPDVRELIEEYSHAPLFKSVRHVVHDEADDAFILGSDFNRGIGLLKEYGIVYDILIFAKHLPNTIRFVDQHPEQPFVLDHIAKPTIATQRFDETWAENFRELAKRENVTCKFSGVVTEVRDEQWSVDTIRPYWDVALDAFGPQRLMFGSDWPVCLLRSSYADWVKAVAELAGRLTADEQDYLWGKTAQRAYHL
jgi:L-fuconolactonase